MKSIVEKPSGEKVEVEWQFDEIIERHDSGWCEWSVTGIGEDGSEWQGCTQAFGSNPEFEVDITDEEEI
jgi:hypothetical protein